MKQRFSSLDVKVIAHELSKSLCPLRVTNIYDLSSRIFLFKFHKPDHREQLIIDSGFRCHLTSYARSTAAAPSPFVARLRKFLKTRRVTSISQVGTDRIIEFQFSDGLYKLYLEFYAGGNIVLTDGDLNILALLRNVDEGAEHEKLRIGLQYNLSLRQNYGGTPPLTKERVQEGLRKAIQKQQDLESTGKKAKKQSKDLLRKALAVSITEFPPLLIDHALTTANFDASIKPEQVLEDGSLLDKLLAALEEAKKVVEGIMSRDTSTGYILAKPNPAANQPRERSAEALDNEKVSELLYDDFHPFRPRQFEDSEYTFLEFEGFNKTVDEFFSSIEGQKLESRLHEREMNAKKKLEQARQEHAKRIGGLQQVQELNIRKAEAIQANIDRVQEATVAVNGLIGQGMDWVEIARLIEREQGQRNPVAQMIKLPLKLYENTVTILLDEPNLAAEEEGYETSSVSGDSDSEEDQPQKKQKAPPKPADNRLAIDIDLGLSPWANASQYYDQKKSAAVKEEKTVLASSKALKSTERKVTADLKKGLKQEKDVLRPVRKQFWFEKFIYFLSSDGYLVLGGKDAQQNEILYSRYLKKGDVYVHADLHGAASVIIKNNPSTPDAPIPPSTLSQAGNLSVATSDAWESKAVMSAWWVNSDQVSKTAPTGEYLTTGGFMIRGKKNFLPPAQLILGFAVMFQISEESKARHVKHRLVDRTISEDNAVESAALQPDEDDLGEHAPEAASDSDSDEDFPDAKLESASDNSDAESEPGGHNNPLQSTGGLQSVQNEQESDSEDEIQGAADTTSNGPQRIEPEISKVELAGDEKEQEAPSIASVQTQGKSGSRHLSARERRLLRKGQSPSLTPSASSPPSARGPETDKEETASEVDETASLATKTRETPTPSSSNPTSKANKGPLPRGKRNKAKKLATKYADQDEEDRALALRLLGSKVGQEAAEAQAQAKKSKEEEAMAQKQRRREQHLRTQALGRATEEARRAAHGTEAAGDEDIVDEEAARLELVGLDTFTGRPLPGDELLAAIPVCAPWSALATYKYKVKLQPGVTKKGKAVKEILGRWDAAGKDPRAVDKNSEDRERIWPREVELIRSWKEAEIFGIVPVGKVRVMMAGGSGGGGGGGSGAAKGKGKSNRGGRGSKRQR
ncbi:hypothetical protein AOQ84DRAFT_333943 [Glonium stellatum]|uniref:Ribosome quality control complex subunit 2 n=1 Tax=Glonium stellatum TaxID=574774 RepID=A0A8E2JWV3_9PEZI|nr:hypothetical protein AOQ84DRAFT_333943 [Glonium stellatum]